MTLFLEYYHPLQKKTKKNKGKYYSLGHKGTLNCNSVSFFSFLATQVFFFFWLFSVIISNWA